MQYYVTVQFNPWDRRTYTYHSAIVPQLAPGEKVVVDTARGEATVEVVGIQHEPPKFTTKPIKRRDT